MDHKDTESWVIQTHEERELIAAEEIIYFSRSPRRNINSTQLQIYIAPDLSTDADQDITEPHSAISVNASGAKHLVSEKPDSKASAFASLLPIARAAEVGASGTGPRESASYVKESTVFNFEEANIPEGGAEVPMDQDYSGCPIRCRPFRPNLTPVTNSILAAIAARNEEPPPSGSPLLLQPLNPDEIGVIHLRGKKEMRDFIVQSRRSMQDSDISSSSSSNQISHREGTQMCDDTQAGMEEDNYYVRPNILDQPVADFVPHYQNEVIIYDGDEDDDEENQGDQNDVEIKHYENPAEINDTEDSLESFFEAFTSSDVSESEDKPRKATQDVNKANTSPWTEGESIKLIKAIQDMSRKMKTSALCLKKSKLKKNGRIIARSIENQIWKINKELNTVNQQTIKDIALPVNGQEDYDWSKVAKEMNANQTPEECSRVRGVVLQPRIITTRTWL